MAKTLEELRQEFPIGALVEYTGAFHNYSPTAVGCPGRVKAVRRSNNGGGGFVDVDWYIKSGPGRPGLAVFADNIRRLSDDEAALILLAHQ